MKKSALLLFSVITTATLMASVADTYPGEGTRVDFFNSTGERIDSRIFDRQDAMYSIFDISRWYEDNNYCINTSNAQRVFSMRFTRYGDESYPVTIETEDNNEDIEVSYSIINEAPEIRGARAAAPGEVRTGTKMRFDITVPDGEFPVMYFHREYTMTYFGEAIWQDVSAFGQSQIRDMAPGNFVWHGYDVLKPEKRAEWRDMCEGHNGFVRDEHNPNHWTYDWVMDNEPVSFRFETIKPDDKTLRRSALGLLGDMYTQYSSLAQGFNSLNTGEPLFSVAYGDFTGSSQLAVLERMSVPDSARTSGFMCYYDNAKTIMPHFPWINAMMWINNANLLLRNIDKYNLASSAVRAESKAQMLVMRSHAYWRMLQLYGKRWSESNNGETLCAPLETEFTVENKPAATMRQIADQCYADLDEAIEILSGSNFERECIWEPDADVARGVKMRIALLREDWNTVREMANSILAHKPLTTNEELLSGFYEPADSWMWGSWNNKNLEQYDMHSQIYYWAFQVHNACNGVYPALWGYPVNAIDRDLFKRLGVDDVRRTLFVMPENLPAPLSREEGWYSSSNMTNNHRGVIAGSKWANLIRGRYSNKAPEGSHSAFTRDDLKIDIQFGSQTKFYHYGSDWDDNAVCFMRADEVVLSLAEACWHLGDMTAAAEALSRLETMRNPSFVAPAGGEELLDAIKLARKIELWGEGHDWYDMKRWSETRVRHAWVEGDVTSGNWDMESNYMAPDNKNGWRIMVPYFAVKYNPLIDVTAYGYEDLSSYEDVPAEKPASSDRNRKRTLTPKMDSSILTAPSVIDK